MWNTTYNLSFSLHAPYTFLVVVVGGGGVRLSNDCSILAVANQNEGTSVLSLGSLTLVKYFRSAAGPETTAVNLTVFSDEYLLERDVHMPLTRNAMEYWNNELGLGWEGTGGLLEQYNPALAMEYVHQNGSPPFLTPISHRFVNTNGPLHTFSLSLFGVF
jgi:hypothetical protein